MARRAVPASAPSPPRPGGIHLHVRHGRHRAKFARQRIQRFRVGRLRAQDERVRERVAIERGDHFAQALGRLQLLECLLAWHETDVAHACVAFQLHAERIGVGALGVGA